MFSGATGLRTLAAPSKRQALQRPTGLFSHMKYFFLEDELFFLFSILKAFLQKSLESFQ